jgi:hypothetical protein
VQGSRASKHDADLDDEIGVTSGRSIGRPSVSDLRLEARSAKHLPR